MHRESCTHAASTTPTSSVTASQTASSSRTASSTASPTATPTVFAVEAPCTMAADGNYCAEQPAEVVGRSLNSSAYAPWCYGSFFSCVGGINLGIQSAPPGTVCLSSAGISTSQPAEFVWPYDPRCTGAAATPAPTPTVGGITVGGGSGSSGTVPATCAWTGIQCSPECGYSYTVCSNGYEYTMATAAGTRCYQVSQRVVAIPSPARATCMRSTIHVRECCLVLTSAT